MKNIRLLLTLAVSTLLVGTLLPVRAQVATPTAIASNTAVPVYAARGPYSVGKTWLMLDKGTSNALLLVAWYPALKQAGNQTGAALVVPDAYTFPKYKAVEAAGDWGTAITNAALDVSGDAYPLVIYSPGSGSSAADYISLEEHLASYGFMVLAPALPLPADNSQWEQDIVRPRLTSREIDFAVHLSNQDGSFKGLIDTNHIGLVGASSGGFTALAAAGARFDFTWFENWCANHKDDPGQYACSDTFEHLQDLLALAKLDAMPKGLWPSLGDSRVTAIISQSGDAIEFGPSGLAPITIPIMVQVGSQDQYVTPQWNAYLTYDNASSAQKAQVVFEGSDHLIFLDPIGGPSALSHLILHFTTAFFLDTIKGDKAAHKALLSDAVNFTGVQYKTTMK